VLAEVACVDDWLGEKVSALEEMASTRIAFISRLGQAMIPTSGTVLQEGDVLHVVAEEGDLPRIAGLFCRPIPGKGAR
jgi:trk system potassium uptake protein